MKIFYKILCVLCVVLCWGGVGDGFLEIDVENKKGFDFTYLQHKCHYTFRVNRWLSEIRPDGWTHYMFSLRGEIKKGKKMSRKRFYM